jgi:hypothetical protein
VFIDAGYGNASKLRAARGSSTWPVFNLRPLVWKPGPRRDRAAKKVHRDASNVISLKELAIRLRAKAWHTIEWREGTNEPQAG